MKKESKTTLEFTHEEFSSLKKIISFLKKELKLVAINKTFEPKEEEFIQELDKEINP